MKNEESSTQDLLSSQRELLPSLYKSHRLFILNYYLTFLTIPLWFLWIIFFAAAMAESLEWFLTIISPTLILGPIVMLIIWSRVRAFSIYMRSAKHFLDNAQRDVESSLVAEDFTGYMNLLFPVLLPLNSSTEDESIQKQQQVHDIIRTLKITPVVEVVILGIVIVSFVSFFLRYPHALPQLLQTPIIPYLLLNLAIMVIQIGVFLRWRQYINRWLALYTGLVAWQKDLESEIKQSMDTSGGAT